MSTERLIQDALHAAGDPGGAFLWRRVCRDLDGDLRIGIVAREELLAQRVVRALSREVDAELVVLRLEQTADDAFSPSLGAQDRLLGVHALIWATPATAPMAAGERDAMGALIEPATAATEDSRSTTITLRPNDPSRPRLRGRRQRPTRRRRSTPGAPRLRRAT